MRVMAYDGALLLLLALAGAWLMWRRRLGTARRYLWVAMVAVPVPFILNTAGWMLTENGRQPWIVQGLLLTRDGVSGSVDTTSLVISILVFLLLYGALAAVDAVLMTRYARKELDLLSAAASE